MDDFDLEIKIEFINEALINLEEAEGSFMELESATEKKPLLDLIFRLAHNLKGGSRAVGFGDVAEFTHQLENLVLKIQKGEVALSSPVVTTLLRSNDRLVEMLTELKNNMAATFDNKDLIKALQELEQQTGETPAPVEAAPMEPEPKAAEPILNLETVDANSEIELSGDEPAPPSTDAFFLDTTPAQAPVVSQPIESISLETKIEKPEAPAATQSKSNDTKPKEKEDEIIRVSLSRIDLLSDYVGELIVLQSVIQQQIGPQAPQKLTAILRQMVKLSKDIQHLSMGLRMLPVKPLVQKLQRVVRDTANTLGKDVSLEVVGEQMDIDKSVLDRLADPLIHILRNAVDHGLETPEERTKSGKSKTGRVCLNFFNEGNHLIVEITDNGKGINTEVLRRKAIEKKIISENQTLTEKQLIHLIFHAGFSTKAVTSEISGRGVGMDVVKTNIEKINGHIDVTTKLGEGSVFRLQIPLSLAVIEGLVVASATSRYVIPLNQVQETINLRTQKVFPSKTGIGACFELRGNIVPLINIEEALGGKADPSAFENSQTALITSVGDQLISVAVKDIIRAQQIVIKPLVNGITAQKGWLGSCVLGDGLPTLILSLSDLLEGKVTQKINPSLVGGAA